jgi:signal peptidase II
VGAVVLLVSGAAVLACDQATKALVGRHGELLLRGVGVRPLTNVRGSLVPLPGAAAVAVWCSVAALAVLPLLLAPAVPETAALGLGLALGGAAGNLVDRLVRGGVLDFVVLWRWPAFNLADAALVAGAALCAWSLV